MSLIIGSTAIKYYYPDFPREPKDLDVAVLTTKGINGRINNTEFLENPIIFKYQQNGYLSPDLMLCLKVSHLFWDINWEKHLYDVSFLLSKGHKWDVNIILELIEQWKEILPKVRRSKLDMSKADFFTNSVNENTNQHDYLHTLLKKVPTFTKLLKEGCEVEVEESKWNLLSFQEKHDAVFEETAVMAYERYKEIDYRSAFKRQLKDNIIKHFPLWMALFSIENYRKIEKPIYNYKQKIQDGLQSN
jgi:hypothetical protein